MTAYFCQTITGKTFTVTTASDIYHDRRSDNNGTTSYCSLRDAISASNLGTMGKVILNSPTVNPVVIDYTIRHGFNPSSYTPIMDVEGGKIG
jgi:CSLREA domain-containing protein